MSFHTQKYSLTHNIHTVGKILKIRRYCNTLFVRAKEEDSGEN